MQNPFAITPSRPLRPSRPLLVVGVVLLVVVVPLVAPGYQSQATELLLFIVFALAWDLVGGQMGYNSFGNVLFVGIGMYVSAIVQVGLFYDVGAYTDAKGGGTAFLFDEAQFLTGLGVGLPAAALASAFICTLGRLRQIAAGIPWIGAGSGMLTPNPPPELGEVGLLLY